MAERLTAGACWGGVKLKLPFVEGKFTKKAGWLALYVLCLVVGRRAIFCCSRSFVDNRRSVYVSPRSPHSIFAPPTSRCFSCDCRKRPVEPGEVSTPPHRHIVPGPSSVHTGETSVLPREASQALPGENGIQKGEPLSFLPTLDAAGKNFNVPSSRQAVLQENFKELERLLEDEPLRSAARKLLRETKLPSSGSALAPALITLEDWGNFDFTAYLNAVSERPAAEVDNDSTVAAAPSREVFLHYYQLTNLNFLTLSLEPPVASAETPGAPRREGEAPRARLVQKLGLLAGKVLGFSELSPLASEDFQKASADSTPSSTTVSTEGSLTSSGSIKQGFADVEGGGSRAGTSSSTVEYSAIDIRGLTGTTNPFLLMRFLLLGVALTGFGRYFDENSSEETLRFFGLDTFLSSLSPHRTPELFNAMTRTHRTPKKKGSLVSRVFRRSSASTLAGQTWSTLDLSGIQAGSHKLLLSILQKHLEVALAYSQQQLDVLKEARVPVESSLSFAENLHRLHTHACLPGESNKYQLPCAFEGTNLHKSSRDPSELIATDNEAAKRALYQQNLKTAFLTITGLGSSKLRTTNQGLDIWTARLLSDPQLGVATNKWFMYDTETLRKLLAKFNANAKRTLKPYGLEKLLTAHKRDTRHPEQDVQLVEKALRQKYDRRTAMRACLYAFMLTPQFSPYQKTGRSPLQFVRAIFAGEPAPLLASTRLNPVLVDDLVEHGEPHGYTFIWLFEFLSQADSASALANKRAAARRTRAWIRIVHSHKRRLLRRLYRKWKVGLSGRRRQKRLQRARNLLLRRLPHDWKETVTQAFHFTAHTAALQQVTTFQPFFRIKPADDQEGETKHQNESVVKRCAEQIYKWSRHGLPPGILEADVHSRSYAEQWHSVKLETLPTPDIAEWWRRLHFIILQGLQQYLQQEKHLEGLEDNIYTLVADTVKRMEEGTSPGSTFFLARVGTPTRQTKYARITGKVKKTLGKLLREVPQSKHVVWVGVDFDTHRITTLLRRLRDIAQNTTDVGTALLLDEAFLNLVVETVRMKTTGVLRQPLPSLRNVSVLAIRSDYAKLSSVERAAEYDNSLCADHCVGIWQVMLSFVYPALLNPSMLSHYEKEYARAGAQKMLKHPDYVNSLRYVFTSDAMLNFWQYTTPSRIKEGVKGMEEGASLMYANLMRLAGLFYSESLGLHNLGHTLQIQGAFMGQAVEDWISKRSAARKKAILSALTLGMMFVYTVVSTFGIYNVMKDVGMALIQECSWNSIMQEMACIPAVAGAQSVTTPLFAALNDVFHVGLFAGIGSAMVGALGLGGVYAIIRSESRTVMRMEMVLSQVIVRIWRRVGAFASRAFAFVRRRNVVVSTMMARATAVFNKNAQASLAPQVGTTGFQLIDSVLQEQPQIGAPD